MKRKLRLLLAVALAMTMVMGMSLTAFAEPSAEEQVKSIISSIDFEDLQYEGKNVIELFDNDAASIKSLLVAAVDRAGVNVSGNTYTITNYTELFHIKVNDTMNVVEFIYEDSEYGDYIQFVSQRYGGGTTPGSDPTPPTNGTSAHTHEWIEGEIYAASQNSDGLEGIYCKTCGAIKESHSISAYTYSLNSYAIPMINAAKSGQTITFEFGEWNSFPKSFMAKLVDKSAQNVTFVFKYKWNHKLQTITIPAGTPIDLNFDWYGPAKMAELYGAN